MQCRVARVLSKCEHPTKLKEAIQDVYRRQRVKATVRWSVQENPVLRSWRTRIKLSGGRIVTATARDRKDRSPARVAINAHEEHHRFDL